MNPTYDRKAAVTFLSREAGGRKTSVESGYRPTATVLDTQEAWDVRCIFPETPVLQPGESGLVLLKFLSSEARERFPPSARFYLREGWKIVASGAILE